MLKGVIRFKYITVAYIAVMGIPSYFMHIVQRHRNIIKKYEHHKMIIQNLYLDCNSLIYDAVYGLVSQSISKDIENKIINEVCKKLIQYINIIKPTNNILIAFDGVAPVAKLSQQKTRRYKSWFQEKLINDICNNPDENKWSTTAITPGTNFMKKLGERITARFADPHEFSLNKIIISTSDEVGEGEHKIFDYIRNNGEYHKKTKTVIYGLDADLIMLTLNHLHVSEGIYLYRETPHFISNIDKTLDPDTSYLLDIPEFAKILSEELNDGNPVTTDQQKRRIFDYILLCFFLGNDFMPHFPSLNIRTSGIDRLMNVYKHVFGNSKENLTDGKAIIWKNMRKFISVLANNESEYIKEEYKIRNKFHNKFRIHKRTNDNISKNDDIKDKRKEIEKEMRLIPMRERKIEKHINPYESGWQKRYYATLFDLKIDDERRREISLNYLEGLEWTMNYYTTGCIDWRWKYNYDYPPLLSDLIKYVPYFDTNLIEPKKENPVSPIVQLSYVLPRSSLTLLPDKIHKLLINKYPERYKTNYKFEWAFCKYFWEAHIKTPEIDIAELENTLAHLLMPI
jgi:5'-3' exonuclease